MTIISQTTIAQQSICSRLQEAVGCAGEWEAEEPADRRQGHDRRWSREKDCGKRCHDNQPNKSGTMIGGGEMKGRGRGSGGL